MPRDSLMRVKSPTKRVRREPALAPWLLSDMAERDRDRDGNHRPHSTAAIAGHPIHPMLVPFPIVCFIGALVTDIVYSQTALIMWSTFSSWLLTAGLLIGAFAALAGLIDFFNDRYLRGSSVAIAHMLINIAVWIIELFNAFVHARDGWTSVVPTGLTLSIIAVLLLAVSGWLGGSLVYKHGAGTPP
jgi:uncharacterized membrane protein